MFNKLMVVQAGSITEATLDQIIYRALNYTTTRVNWPTSWQFSSGRREHPVRHLKAFSGILQADAYGGYNELYDPSRAEGPIMSATGGSCHGPADCGWPAFMAGRYRSRTTSAIAMVSPELILASYSCAIRDQLPSATCGLEPNVSCARLTVAGSANFLMPTFANFAVGTRNVILSLMKLITKSSSLAPEISCSSIARI
jgi:hypothetical protein